ncbi:unnamed protein product [Microthlaspi erraticum]|uniref:F-box domain-containing protein n=1 Tax=Microthlaspi erraticum TaxID=1685480 RepID=A0A6D2JIY9_9BRAS|nr:unnamed protein product [Microthlaspi erraticum]
MTTISDLPWDLVEEILSRVRAPITSLGAVRFTCKRWNAYSKEREAKQQFVGFMMKNFRVCSVRFDVHGILHNDDVHEEFFQSTKKLGNVHNQVEVSQVFHCDGLLLCATRGNTGLVVWNPYLGQTRWIKPRNTYHILDKSDSWRVRNVTPDWDRGLYPGASLNGNAYFLACAPEGDGTLVCFDFTRESFGQFLPPPSSYCYYDSYITMSSLREEKLAALFQDRTHCEMEIWVTAKIERNEEVSWSKFLKFDFQFDYTVDSFFVEEEKKLAVVFDLEKSNESTKHRLGNAAYVIGEKGCLKVVNLGESNGCCIPLVCSSSYVPSLVQVNRELQETK